MKSYQNSIAKDVSIAGFGLHTGAKVSLTFKPAEADFGLAFKRVDIENQPVVPAHAKFVTHTERGTTLELGEASVSTVEHVLAALTGLGIDNCMIEVNGPEMPIMDGSAMPFVEVLEKAGIDQQDKERSYFVIKEAIRLYDEKEDVEILALPSDTYEVSVLVDYGTKVLGSQNASLKDLSHFKEEIARCRTFSFLHELEYLLDNGLIKGGDLNNAIVYVDQEVSEEKLNKLKKAFNKESVSVQPNGILDNLELHYPNEAARHKLLDVIGDLSLAGKPIKGRIIANRPGHKINTNFAKLLAQKIKEDMRRSDVPEYDPNKTPVYNVTEIMNILPHRPPFLLVDKVMEISEEHVVAVKSVTMNEPFFTGHFPGAPVMPGVLQVEAMAQAGGILALSTVPDPENYLTYFLKIDGVRFKKQVVPGDTLIFRLEMDEPSRRGIVKMTGKAYVGDTLVCEALMMAQIAKKK
jgi:UDP-3-O-[3-hydroxymyristoyl] N-acetylglucosamine deacetylase/3-hydroxyacyl-[acyl-carrier-protein] dehydratase